MKVTSEMTIGELIRLDENIVPILMRAACTALAVLPLRANLLLRPLWSMDSTVIC